MPWIGCIGRAGRPPGDVAQMAAGRIERAGGGEFEQIVEVEITRERD